MLLLLGDVGEAGRGLAVMSPWRPERGGLGGDAPAGPAFQFAVVMSAFAALMSSAQLVRVRVPNWVTLDAWANAPHTHTHGGLMQDTGFIETLRTKEGRRVKKMGTLKTQVLPGGNSKILPLGVPLKQHGAPLPGSPMV